MSGRADGEMLLYIYLMYPSELIRVEFTSLSQLDTVHAPIDRQCPMSSYTGYTERSLCPHVAEIKSLARRRAAGKVQTVWTGFEMIH